MEQMMEVQKLAAGVKKEIEAHEKEEARVRSELKDQSWRIKDLENNEKVQSDMKKAEYKVK